MAQELVKNNSIISDLIKNEKQISSAISANTPNEKKEYLNYFLILIGLSQQKDTT